MQTTLLTSGLGAVNSAANSVRLKTVLALQEAGILDGVGKLTAQAIKGATDALKTDTVLCNPSVVAALTKDGSNITDWAKKTTDSITMPTGQRIQVHFYQNKITKQVDYSHIDYKVKNPVGRFDKIPRNTAYKPTSVDDILRKYKK